MQSKQLFSFLVVHFKMDTSRLDTIAAILEMIWSFAAIFLFCEFGEKVTERFEKFHDELWQCDWYLCSAEIQRIYLLFMVDVQQLALFKGYANIRCTREMFKKVKLIENRKLKLMENLWF